MPFLHYPAEALAQLGAEVHIIDYPDFLVLADAPNEQQLEQASQAIARTVADHVEEATRVTMLAKSLGTRIIARLPSDILPSDADAIWLTPIFVDARTAEAAAKTSWRSLYIYGTADPACVDEAMHDIVSATGSEVLSIDGADHALEIEGDVEASVAALARVTGAVLRFIGS